MDNNIIINTNMSCIDYDVKFIDFLFPTSTILHKVCSIRSKTLMFLICVIRIFLMVYFYEVTKTMLYGNIFYLAIFVNIIAFCLILIKKPMYDNDQITSNLQSDVDFIANQLDNKVIDRSDNIKLADKIFDPEIITPAKHIRNTIN